jgi:N-acetylneuraminic acid mutarotase
MEKRTLLLTMIIMFSLGAKLVYSQGECWVKKTDMPTVRVFSSASTVDGKVYVFGGTIGSPYAGMDAVESYDPNTDTWTEEPKLPRAVCGPATCAIDGDIYIIGGATDMFGTAVSSVYAYNVSTKTYLTKTNMPTARGYPTASVVNGRIYVIGGSSSGFATVFKTLEVYDPATDSWEKKADMPTARACLSSSVVDGKIYVIGGTVQSPWPGLSTVEVYNPDTDSWTKKADMPTARWTFFTCVLDGKIYSVGGDSESSGSLIEFSSVEEYNPQLDSWTRKTDMPTKSGGLSGSVVNGKIYAIGGGFHEEGRLYVISTVEEYDPALDITSVGNWEDVIGLPMDYSLNQNYPNPFNPCTRIEFSVPRSTFVTLKVFNLLGEEIATLAAQEFKAGTYTLDWNAKGVASGVYLYRLVAGSFVETKKMLLLR